MFISLINRSSSVLDDIFEIFLILVHVSVDEKLCEHAEIQEKRAQAAKQPAEVDQDISAVDCASLTRSALLSVLAMVADRVESENTENVGQVTNASEEEEQCVKTFGALATVVEEELRDTAAKVEYSTQVAEDLTNNVEVETVVLLLLGLASIVGRGAQVVASNTSCNNEDNAGQVEQQLLHDCALGGSRLLHLGSGMHGVGRRHVNTIADEALAERRC